MDIGTNHLVQDASSSPSAALYARAARVFPGGFTRATLTREGRPLFASHGQGARIYDVEGAEYRDFANNFTALIHGHAAEPIAAALASQAARGTCFSLPAEREIALAEALCDRVPSNEQICFCNTGTEGVLFALKAARGFTGRDLVAKCEGAYHGMSDFAEVSNDPTPGDWGDPYPASVPAYGYAPGAIQQLVKVIPFNDLERALEILRPVADRLACILIDPMPSRAGLVPASAEFLEGLRRFCDEHGVLLIYDQVMSFRLALGGCEEFFGVAADLSVFGKVIGGGLPIGAIGGPARFMEVFSGRAGKAKVTIGGTFSANPMSTVAGYEALRLLTQADLERLNGWGDEIREALRAFVAREAIDASISGAGSLFKIHPVGRVVTGYRSAFLQGDERIRLRKLVGGLEERGIHLLPSAMGCLSTAMEQGDVDAFIEAATASLKAL